MVEEDNWKELENLGNMMELVKEFKKDIREEEIKKVQYRNC